MKKSILTAMILLFGIALSFGQFTTENAPAIGQSQTMYVLDSLTDAYSATTGDGVTWNYSEVTGVDGQTILMSYKSPQETEFASDFPNSQIASEIEGYVTTFYSEGSFGRSGHGFAMSGMEEVGTVVATLNSNPETLISYPFDFGSSPINDNFAGQVTLNPMGQGEQTQDVSGTVNVSIDGRGTLITTQNTYSNVLRYKIVETVNTSLDMGIPFPINVTLVRTQYEYYDHSTSNMPLMIHSNLSVEVPFFDVPDMHIVLSVDNPEAVAATPMLTATPMNLSGFYQVVGTPSESQTFTVEGVDLTGDITLSVSGNYEISFTAGEGYASSQTISTTGGNVAATTIYVRLNGNAAEVPSNGLVTISSEGATDVVVILEGEIVLTTPIVEVIAPSCTTNGAAIISNYEDGVNYIFSPEGPSVDGEGNIIDADYGVTYTVTASAGGSEVTSEPFVIENQFDNPEEPIVEVTNATCNANGAASISNYFEDMTYVISPEGPAIDEEGNIIDAEFGVAYTITVSDELCSATSEEFTIEEQLESAEIPIITIVDPTCTEDGYAIIENYDSEITYTFLSGSGVSIDDEGIITAPAGETFVIIANNGSCSASSEPHSVEGQFDNPEEPIVEVTNPTCSDDGFAVVSNYSEETTYVFSPEGPAINEEGNIIDAEFGETYTITVSTEECSVTTDEFVINEQLENVDVPNVVVIDPTCSSDGYAFIENYQSGATYTFSEEGVSVDEEGNIEGIEFGVSYTVTVTDGECDATSEEFDVEEQLEALSDPIVEVSEATCDEAGVAVISNYNSNATYVFSPEGPSVDEEGNIVDMETGVTYSMIASEGECDAMAVEFAVDEQLSTPDVPSVVVVASTCVADGTAHIENFDEEASYTFSTEGPSIDEEGNIEGLEFGVSYTVSVTNGECEAISEEFAIEEQGEMDAPVVEVIEATCGVDGVAIISNFNNDADYTFSPEGPSVDEEGNIVDAEFGVVYTVTVVVEDCEATSEEFTIDEQLSMPDAPSVMVVDASCDENGYAFIDNYNNELTYTINSEIEGASINEDGSIEGMEFGVGYTVTVSNGECEATSEGFAIEGQFPSPEVNVISNDDANCEGNSSAIIENFNSEYVYTLSSEDVSIDEDGVITGEAGTYTVTAINEIGCESTSVEFTIDEQLSSPEAPVVAVTDPTCAAGGSAVLANLEEDATYTFSPEGPSIDEEGNILDAEFDVTYTIEVSNGECATTSEFTLEDQLDALEEPVVEVTSATCEEASSAIISNFNNSITYVFEPEGPSVDENGNIIDVDFGVAYTVAATDGDCEATSDEFTMDEQLDVPETPIVFVVDATTEEDGFAYVENYDSEASYTIMPEGASIDEEGNIVDADFGVAYTVTVSNGECESTSEEFVIEEQIPVADGTPIISMIMSAACPGQIPKMVEIYAYGTVDFADYSIEHQVNANTEWTDALNLGELGIITNDYVYVVYDNGQDGLSQFYNEFPNAVYVLETTSSVVNNNGDDRVRIIAVEDGTVIDQYGETDVQAIEGVDDWYYRQGYAIRIDGTTPNGEWQPDAWSYHGGELLNECGNGIGDLSGSGTYDPEGEPAVIPVIIATPTNLSGFLQFVGEPSPEQMFTVIGENLTEDIALEVTGDYEMSTEADGTYTTTLTIAQVDGGVEETPVYVRLNGDVAQVSSNGLIILSSEGANNAEVILEGIIADDTPLIIATPNSLSGFSNFVGTPSETQTFEAVGYNLLEAISITAPENFEISEDGASYGTTISLEEVDGQVASTTIYVRLNGTELNLNQSGDIVLSSLDATDALVHLEGVTNDYLVTTIEEIRDTDDNGSATMNGQFVQVTGVVHCDNFREGGYEFVILDENNDGMTIFKNFIVDDYTPTEGDEITVKGQVTQFNGLTELEPDFITLNSQGNEMFEPTVVTALGEDTESQYIMLENVTVTGSETVWPNNNNINVTDGTNVFQIRVPANAPIAGTPIPSGAFNIIGVGKQFDSSSPYDSGYQMFPCSAEGIEVECDWEATVTVTDMGLVASPSNADSYQWIDCSNGSEIAGATGQEFTPNESGSYAVVVTVGDCEDTSDCAEYEVSGLDINTLLNVNVYPNPMENQLNVVDEGGNITSVEMITVEGNVVYQTSETSSTVSINTSRLANGVYFVKVKTLEGQRTFKVVK